MYNVVLVLDIQQSDSYIYIWCLILERKAMTNLDSILKIRDITSMTKVHLVKATVFPVVVYRCESWTIKKAEGQRTDAFEDLDSTEIKPVDTKGNQPWIFVGRTDAEDETPLWPPDVKSWLTGRDPDSGNDWRQKEKGTTEDEMIR